MNGDWSSSLLRQGEGREYRNARTRINEEEKMGRKTLTLEGAKQDTREQGATAGDSARKP
jgi:hypothetical protein